MPGDNTVLWLSAVEAFVQSIPGFVVIYPHA